MKKRLLSLLLVLVMLAGMVPFGALAADAGDALQFDYDGDSLNVIKEDGSGFGMFAPQAGSKVTVSGDQVNVTLYTKNGTIYKGFYLNTRITDETLDEANFIGGAEYGGSPYGAYTFSLSKDYCGKATAIRPEKPAGGTTGAQYYLAIPALDKIPVGSMVMSFELFDREKGTIALLKNPTLMEFTSADTGYTLAQKLLGAENVNVYDSGWMKSFTIDGIEYSPESMELATGSWLVYKNNATDGDFITGYKPANGDVYRVVLSTYDPVTYAMPVFPHNMNALYWAMVGASGDLTQAYALIQKDPAPTQEEIDAMVAALATPGGEHFISIDNRTIWVNPDYTSFTTLTADKTSAAAGETVTVTVTLPEGVVMVPGSLKANGAALTEGEGGKWTFVMPDAPVTVTAEFAADEGGKLLGAEFYLDSEGTESLAFTPAFDKDVTHYAVDFFDAQVDADGLYFKATLPTGATAKWQTYMDYGGSGFYTDGPAAENGVIGELNQASFYFPGMSNGYEHRLDVTSAGGTTTPYYFKMTMRPALDTLEIGGEEIDDFDAAVLAYALELPAGTESITIHATPYNEEAYVYLNDGDDDIADKDTVVALQSGENTVKLTVDDDAGATAEYVLTVTVAEGPAYPELNITNNTGMFKAVSAHLEPDGENSVLVMALSGTGYKKLFKGTYEQAVANGEARENWIEGYQNAEGKWEFRIPVLAGESYIPVVAISQSYLDKHDQGQNSLERAFYPRQMEIDAQALTLVTGDYEYTQTLEYTNNVSMFKVSGAALHTVGGPNSNNYKADMVLTMGSTSFDKAFVGYADEAAAAAATIALGEENIFEIPVKWVETFGQPETLKTLIGEPFVISFHSVSKDAWYERQFTISETDGTLVIDPAPTPAEDAQVFLTVSNAGVLALARTAVTVKDTNRDGILSFEEALIAAHKEYCPDGYAAGMGSWGYAVSKLWGVENGGSYLFYQNDASFYTTVDATPVAAGDDLVAAVMADTATWSDHYTFFAAKTLTATAGKAVTLTLKKDESGAAMAAADVQIGTWSSGAFTALEGKKTDAEGSVTLTFAEPGTYVVSAAGPVKGLIYGSDDPVDCAIIAPVCIITVEEAQSVPAGLQLTELAFKSGSGATAAVYGLEPAFDPAVAEYTLVLPDSATTAYAWAVAAEGVEGAITATYPKSGTGADMDKALTSGSNTYLGTLAAGSSFTGSTMTIKVGGEAAYTIHIVRGATLAAGTNGFTLTVNGTAQTLTPAYNRTVYEYTVVIPADAQLSIKAKPTVTAAALKINGQAAAASTAVEFAPVWGEDRTFTMTVEVEGEGAVTGTYTIRAVQALAALEITKAPDKLVYAPGDVFDPTGMEIKGTYADGTSVVIPAADCAITPSGPLSLGDTVITIAYGGASAEQAISFTTAFTGAGTQADPYLINNAEDLQTLDAYVEGGETFAGCFIKLNADITVPEGFNGIGSNGGRTGQLGANADCKPFSGDFDGGGHTVTIPAGGKALFDFVRTASIHDLSIYGTQIADYALISTYISDSGVSSVAVIDNVTLKSGTQTLYSGFIGGYAGGANAVTIKNSTVESGVVIGYTKDQDWIGSFAGEFNGTITNCVSNAAVYGKNFVGGIVADKGQTMGTFVVENCTFGGTVEATGDYVGGIAGAGYGGTRWGMNSAWSCPGVTIRGCASSGTISGVRGVGGIFGGEGAQAQAWENGPTWIENNTFTGTVTGTKYVGGVIGYIFSINKNTHIDGNTTTSPAGVIGAAGAIDTYAHASGMYDGVLYFNTSTADGRTAAEIRSVVGSTLENYITISTLGSSGYANQFKLDHNLTYDPLHETLSITVGGEYKTEYLVGDQFDKTGVTVTAALSDGTTVDVTPYVEFSGFDSSEAGDKLVTVTYGALTTTFTVTVKITVKLTVLGDTHHDMAEGDKGHGLWLGGLETWLPETEYALKSGDTAWILFNQAFDADDDLTLFSRWTDEFESEYIYAVQKGDVKLTEKDNCSKSGWMVALNGEHVQTGVSKMTLKNGDEVILHWCDDYEADEGEGSAQHQEDVRAAMAVEDLIDAIGQVTLEKEQAIAEARAAYDALTDTQKALVTNYDTLTAAEATLAQLAEERDQAAADAVIAQIAALGEVTLDSEEAVAAARAAYDALTDAQKAKVTNLDALTAAEAAIKELKDEAAAQAVMDMIAAIGDVTIDDEEAIAAARAAYDALTDDQKAKVANLDTLTAAETAIAPLIDERDQQAADAVIAKIDAIGEVTLEKEEAITAARAAYDALTDAQKAKVTNLAVLTAAETELAKLKFSELKPAVKAENVKSSGKIKLTWEEVPGAVSYKVFVATAADGEYALAAEVTDPTYTYSGKAGSKYFFKVVAVNEAGTESAESDVINKFQVPAQVTKLKAKSAKAKQVTLTWKKITGAKKYFVYMSKNGKTGWKKIGTAKTNKFIYKKAAAGKKLYFKVQAVTANGKKGEFSKVVSVKVKK